ncbi:MAG: hypothetical protein V3G42_13480, partial [Oscillospiraceae bacterium]
MAKRNYFKRVLAGTLAILTVAVYLPANVDTGGFFGGTTIIAHAADEVSENISLVASVSSNLKTISGTHYSVSCGYLCAGSTGMTVNSFGALTINARKGETITKVVLTYNWGNNKSSLSASAGTFDGNATISDINAQQVTISSSSDAGVKISAVTVYFEGSLSNPTVTLTGGANAKSSGGLLTQSYLPGAMDTVTYTALTGAAFPEFETYTQNGVTVERTSDTVVTISGTPTANTAITVPDAESSSKIVTWGSSLLNGDDFGNQIYSNNSYSDTANGITLTKSGSGYASLDYGDWMTSGDVTLNFTTATGKFTSIEIEASKIYDGGNWTKDGNTLKWNGTPSNSVSLSGSRLYLSGVSSVNFVIEMPADLSTATVTLGADNTVSSVTVGGNEITDLSEFDITYGTDESHTATEPPTEDGTYYAYVTAKTESENYTGTAKSAEFTVVNAINLTAENVTIADFTYDGTEKTPVLKYGDTVLEKDTDYTIVATDGDNTSAINADTYTIHINGINNYAGENIALTWNINKAEYTVEEIAAMKPTANTVYYNGTPQTLITMPENLPEGVKVNLKLSDEKLSASQLWSSIYGDGGWIASPEQTEVGTYYYYWKITPDSNHNAYPDTTDFTDADAEFLCLTAKIDYKPTNLKLSNLGDVVVTDSDGVKITDTSALTVGTYYIYTNKSIAESDATE